MNATSTSGSTIELPKMLAETPTMAIALGFMVVAATSLIAIAGRRVRRKTLDAIRDRVKLRSAAHGESMSFNDALRFPLYGSCMLFSLYAAIKYLPKHWLGYFMTGYLTLASVASMSVVVKPVVGASVPVGLACCAVGAAYVATQHWVLNNVMAFALCVTAMELLHIKAYLTGAALLGGLFVYDIFWVFGTDVMVTVARSIQGPIKLVFPHDIFGDHEKKSLLGLGDIVIPGVFLMQVLRMSLFRSHGRDATYYHVAMVAYVLSLVNTMGVMVFFEAAQPALLYIVPWLLLSVAGTAVARGEFWSIVRFDEDAHDALRLADVLLPNEAAAPVLSREGSVAASLARVADQPSFSEELWQAVLSIFGQDDEYLHEMRMMSRKAM